MTYNNNAYTSLAYINNLKFKMTHYSMLLTGLHSMHIGSWLCQRARSPVTWCDTYAYQISFIYVHVGSVIVGYEAKFMCPVGGAMDMTQY